MGISGSIAIVGANHDDDNGSQSGSAYLFNTTTGQQIAKLLPQEGDEGLGNWFGISVGISGTTVIVGARRDDVNGFSSGSAYIFEKDEGGPDNWGQVAKLLPEDGTTGDLFAHSVGISGTTAIAGSHKTGNESGAAYLFDTTTGKQLYKLVGSDTNPFDNLGWSVAISGNIAIAGADAEEDDSKRPVTTGAAYLFDITTGQQIAKLLADDGVRLDWFGRSIGISGNIAIVGAEKDDDNGDESGSAYLFNATTGQQIAKLLPDDGAPNDWFGGVGRTVAISGVTAIVGSPYPTLGVRLIPCVATPARHTFSMRTPLLLAARRI